MEDAQPISLDVERARRFLQKLEQLPFVAVVVIDGQEVAIYSKDIRKEHLDMIREVLEEVTNG